MKSVLHAALIVSVLSSQAAMAGAKGSVTYEVALQNAHGVERRSVTLAPGGQPHRLSMAGGIVELTPPGRHADRAVIRLFSDDAAHPVLLHTASIGGMSSAPLRLAYTVCGKSVRFESPAPEQLAPCGAGTRVNDRP